MEVGTTYYVTGASTFTANFELKAFDLKLKAGEHGTVYDETITEYIIENITYGTYYEVLSNGGIKFTESGTSNTYTISVFPDTVNGYVYNE